MKKFIVSVGCTVAFLMVSSVALAQGKGSGASKPKVSTGSAKSGSVSHGGGKTAHVTTATGPRTSAQGGAKAHGPTLKQSTTTVKATGPKTKSTTTAKATGPKTKSTTTTAKATGPKTKSTTTAKATGPKTKSTTTTAKETGPKTKSTTTTTASTSTGKSKKETTTTASTSTDTSKKDTTTTVATGETLSAVQQKLQRNTNLAKKLESRLPAGTDLMDAAKDFRNLGQFVAAVNASYNHDLDFDKLKIAMVDEGMSLGQAMKDQRSSLDGGAEAVRIQREADVMVRTSEAASTTTSTTTSTTSTQKPATAKPKDRQ